MSTTVNDLYKELGIIIKNGNGDLPVYTTDASSQPEVYTGSNVYVGEVYEFDDECTFQSEEDSEGEVVETINACVIETF